MLVVAVDVTRPLDGLWPNRLYTSLPMVWGRCRYSYIGRPHTMDNDIFKSRSSPWCGDFVFWCCNKLRKRPRKSIVEVRYYSTVWTPFELRRCKTRVKLVPDHHLFQHFWDHSWHYFSFDDVFFQRVNLEHNIIDHPINCTSLQCHNFSFFAWACISSNLP